MESENSDTAPPGPEQTTPPQQFIWPSVVVSASTKHDENDLGDVAAKQLALPKQEDQETPAFDPRPSLETDSKEYIISDSESEAEAAADENADFEDSGEEGSSSDDELQVQIKKKSTKPTRDGKLREAINRKRRNASEEDQDLPRDEKPHRRPRSRKTKTAIDIEISETEKEISMELGLRSLVGRNDLTDKLYPLGTADNQDDEFEGSDEVQPLGEHDEDWLNDIDAFLNELSVTEGARKSSSKPAIPNSTSTNKRKGLREIARAAIAENPTANRREVFKDSRSVEIATRLFTHMPHMDGTGLWKMDGMKSSLYHYQVQGTGWMRKRERSRDIIRGGILADIMGLGKTITALATILDGKRVDLNKPRAPTLIIVPSQLVSNWKRQLTSHFHLSAFGTVRQFTKEMNADFDDNINGLGLIDVVMATYQDVRKSYPSLKPPGDIHTTEALTAWWLANYEAANYGDSVGLLHKVHWHRILIDEGHTIRNHWSQVSVAVRALTGGLKWILTGTPLHNGIEDFFPYFNFLKVPHSMTYEEFVAKYCKEEPSAKARLIATIRPFFKRRTSGSTLFGLPIVSMHGLKEEDVVVEFCQAERIIYDTLVRTYRERINELGRCASAQENCIWFMMIRLRLFSSHPLTAQVIVQHLLKNEEIRASLEGSAQDGTHLDHASTEIIQFFDSAKKMSKSRDSPAAVESQQSEIARRTKVGDKTNLTQNLRKTTKECWDDENWRSYHERVDQKCALCYEHFDPGFILTSCAHLYCGDCFKTLPDNQGTDTGTPVCCRCHIPITEAVVLGAIDDSCLYDGLSSSPAPGTKRLKGQESQPSKRVKTHSSNSRMFTIRPSSSGHNEGDDEDTEDLIPFVGNFHSRATMLGSKLTKARDLIHTWMQEDSSNKVVVFTHFLSSLRLLELVCQEQKWVYTKLSGKMPIPARDQQIMKFQKNEQVKVMLSTMNTGSVGIDLTAANKCILLDLWWNLAVEEQANFRLFRLGQTREVHCVKLIAKGTREAEVTIDQKMLAMQHAKMENIQGVIGSNALSRPVEQFLQCLGRVVKTEKGGFKIIKDVPAEEADNQAQGADARPEN